MTTATRNETTLTRSTKSGSYMHRITFAPQGDTVRITEVMHDSLMGDWIGNSQNRTVPVSEARAYYRDRKAFGYK